MKKYQELILQSFLILLACMLFLLSYPSGASGVKSPSIDQKENGEDESDCKSNADKKEFLKIYDKEIEICAKYINELVKISKSVKRCKEGKCTAQEIGKLESRVQSIDEKLNEVIEKIEELIETNTCNEDESNKLRKRARGKGCLNIQ